MESCSVKLGACDVTVDVMSDDVMTLVDVITSRVSMDHTHR